MLLNPDLKTDCDCIISLLNCVYPVIYWIKSFGTGFIFGAFEIVVDNVTQHRQHVKGLSAFISSVTLKKCEKTQCT